MTIQTARLSRGAHAGPQQGVCALELAGMLADAPWSDRPACVCPALAAFVRGYNDAIDDRRRQDLIRLAPDLVDTRAGEDVRRARAARCFALAAEARRAAGPLRRLPARFPHEDESQNLEVAGRNVARAARRRPEWHERALAMVAALADPAPAPAAPAPAASAPAAAPAAAGAAARDPAPAGAPTRGARARSCV